MKIISWNVNGIRACLNKGFMDFFKQEEADIFAIQETKMQVGQADISIPGYFLYQNDAIKKGYSGTAIYTKKEPISVMYGIDNELYNDEGRIITLEYNDFYFVCVYVPNSQDGLKRLDYRMEFEDNFRAYLNKLKEKKNVIMCGDLNVAHEEIDIKNPKANEGNNGFTKEERGKFSKLLMSGFSDSFRTLYPDRIEYSWWSYRFNARAHNAGWRIDYFIVNDDFMTNVVDSGIYTTIEGSDHAPIFLLLKESN